MTTAGGRWRRCGVSFLAILGLILGCELSEDEGYNGVDVGDDCPTAASIQANSVTSGALEAGDDWDVFEVVLNSAGTLRAYTTGTTDTLGAVLDQQCEPLVTDDDGGSGLNFDTRVTVGGSGGTFYVVVTGATEETTGPYVLHVEFSGSTGGATPEHCTMSWRLILEYEEEDLRNPGTPPRVYEWEAIDYMTFSPSGTWDGDEYDGGFEGASISNRVSFRLASDRSKVGSFSGSHSEGVQDWEISGANVPIVLDAPLLSTLKAYVSGPATCDAVDQVAEEPSNNGIWINTLTGFRCSSESYLEIYCD